MPMGAHGVSFGGLSVIKEESKVRDYSRGRMQTCTGILHTHIVYSCRSGHLDGAF